MDKNRVDTRRAAAHLDRRGLFRLAASGAGALALGTMGRLGSIEAGQSSGIEALVLNCIDYRLVGAIAPYMDRRGLTKQYDQFILAGAALGVNTDQFPAWGQSFWEHVQVAIDLHDIKRIIAIDHRDCGAYTVILGEDLYSDRARETRLHREQLRTLAASANQRFPALAVELLLMDLDASVETVPLTDSADTAGLLRPPTRST